jgi:transposase
MVRSRRTKIAPEDKLRVVLSVLAAEMSAREAARRLGVSPDLVTKWKHQFLEAGAQRLQEVPSGPAGAKGPPEQRRLQMENEQLKLALAEATVQLRIWQRGAAFADQVPSPTSKPSER